MLILTAHNVTRGNGTNPDGTAEYEVRLAVNDRVFWQGNVSGHIRSAGATVLLRKIADRMERSVRDDPSRRTKSGNGNNPDGKVRLGLEERRGRGR